MAGIKTVRNNKYWHRWKKRNSPAMSMEIFVVIGIVENGMKFLQKIKTRNTIESSNSTTRYLPKENRNNFFKDIYTPILIAALFTTVKVWKQSKCPLLDEWIKMLYIHTNGILFSPKKEWDLAICNYTDGPRGYYVK